MGRRLEYGCRADTVSAKIRSICQLVLRVSPIRDVAKFSLNLIQPKEETG